jgi:uncharacterized protein YndB with AHSA1/START domain
MENKKITVETLVNADTQKTWEKFTSPEHIIHWNFASDDWHCPKASNDLTTGGKFSYTMASRDGKMSFDFAGVYDEVIDRKKIAYSLGDKRQVDVRFEDLGDKTRVVESFDPETVNSAELQRNGWQTILDNFKKYVESK